MRLTSLVHFRFQSNSSSKQRNYYRVQVGVSSVLLLILGLSLIACGDNGSATTMPVSNPNPTSPIVSTTSKDSAVNSSGSSPTTTVAQPDQNSTNPPASQTVASNPTPITTKSAAATSSTPTQPAAAATTAPNPPSSPDLSIKKPDPNNPLVKAGLVYPGSSLVANLQQALTGQKATTRYSLSYSTLDNPQKIVAFYQTALAKWQDLEIDDQDEELVFIDASKEDNQQQLSITISPDLDSEGQQLIELELDF